jgi:hypothetical protein
MRGTGVVYARTHVMKRDSHCYYCGRDTTKHGYTRDHIVPKSKGGTETVTACESCNRMKSNLSLEEFRLLLAFRAELVPSARELLKFAGEGGSLVTLLKAKAKDMHAESVAITTDIAPKDFAPKKKATAMTSEARIAEYQTRADKAVQETLRARRELQELKDTPCSAWWCRLKRSFIRWLA